MKGGHNKKSVRVEFVMSEAEAELVKERMAELGITNLSAYLRKMAVDGYIIHLDMGDIQEMIRLLRICSNNLNQYTRRANETGSIYAADIEDIRTRLDSGEGCEAELTAGRAGGHPPGETLQKGSISQ